MADPFSLALTVAVNLASMALTASQSHEGPRLQDLSVTVADYGTPIPYLLGRRRIECPVMHAEPLREEKTKSKTKGGKYTEYKYYGTWASLVCGNRTYSIRRIWGDRHLLYDLENPRQFLDGDGPKLKPGDNLRFYYGTEDQLPDERIAARIEHDEGDASLTPAYRGTTYVMFEDVPLEQFGNRMPQVSIEVDSTDPTPIEIAGYWEGHELLCETPIIEVEAGWTVCTPRWKGFSVELACSPDWSGDPGVCTCEPDALGGNEAFILLEHTETLGLFCKQAVRQVWARGDYTGPQIWVEPQTIQPTITLGDVCEFVARQAGFAEGDYDFTQLDQVIYGFSWTQGRAADIIMSLLELHDSDIRPNGFIQEGIKRNQPLSGPTITYDWMARRSGDDGSDPLYVLNALSESELPRRIMCVYSEIEAEQQPNTAVAQRNGPSVWTNREVPVDLTSLADTADTIQPLVERVLRRQWMDAVTAEMTLTPKHYGLIPGNTRNLGFENEVTVRGRLHRLVIKADRSLFCQWRRDGAVPVAETDWEDDEGSIVHNLPDAPGAIGSGRPPDDIFDPAPSTGWVLDLPLLSDADDRTAPFAYFAASPNVGTVDEDGNEPDWSGATFLASDSGDPESYENPWEVVGSGSRATHGVCFSTLGPAQATVIDNASQLGVELVIGSLESVTLEELLEDGTLNLALVGDELIQFRDAIRQSGGQYVLGGLIRGCRGTERFIDTHEPGERFILANDMLGIHSMGASEIGDTDYYKVVTNGFNPDNADPFSEEFTGAAHRPYSVVHVTVTKDGDDFIIDGLRRSRIGGSTFSGQDIPLGETSELYRIKMLDDYGETIATRETTSLPFIYTGAMQVEDLSGLQAELTISICQMSPALNLEGYPTTASSED